MNSAMWRVENAILEPRWADGHHDRLPSLVRELVDLKVDVIVAAATPASQAAQSRHHDDAYRLRGSGRTRSRLGWSRVSLQPGGNVTGLSLLTPELSGKRLELLTAGLGTLNAHCRDYEPEERGQCGIPGRDEGSRRTVGHLDRGAWRRARALTWSARLWQLRRNGAGAAIVFDDPVLWSFRREMVALAAAEKLPVMYGYRDFVQDGGLMSYGPNRPDQYRAHRSATWTRF